MQKFLTGWRQWTLAFLFCLPFQAQASVLITGIIDGPLSGGSPKAIELYISGTENLSDYRLERSSNGGAFGSPLSLSGTFTDEFAYLVGTAGNGLTDFQAVFGSNGGFANIVGSASSTVSGNGDDAFRIVRIADSTVIDQVLAGDGNSIHTDSYLYRKDGTGPDSGWVPANWNIPGNDTLDGLTVAQIDAAVPFGTYSAGLPPSGTTLSIANISQAEGNSGTTTFIFTVTRSGDTSAVTSVDFATADGTAVAGSDYTTASDTVTFNANDTTQTIDILVSGDTDTEADETFTITLSNPSADATITTDTATGTIQNDDGVALTLISAIQGSGAASSLVGQTVTIQGVVIGEFNSVSFYGGSVDELDGFFVQEEDTDADTNPSTSEGIFVYCGSTGSNCPAVDEGHIVQVTGTVSEVFDVTQISPSSAADVNVVDNGNNLNLVTPASVSVTDLVSGGDKNAYYEAFESMLVEFAETMYVSEYFELARFGQIVLTEGSRPYQYTHTDTTPTEAEFAAYEAALELRTMILDDDANGNNRPIDTNADANAAYFHPQPGGLDLAAGQGTGFFRGGDAIDNLTGVMNYAFSEWRIRPVDYAVNTFAVVNDRADATPAVTGDVTVASFNVLNYFTSVDTTSNNSGSCGASGTDDCRGADSPAELTRQTDKLVKALAAIDADVFGLIEIENSDDSATLASLTQALNTELGNSDYDYINTGFIGSDAIAVALMYKPSVLMPVGTTVEVDEAAFVDPRNIGPKNRAALIQSFAVIDKNNPGFGEQFTVIVNHLKSKGSSCGAGDDATDGSGNCNGTRTDAADYLVNTVLAGSNPTGINDTDYLIIGDLNAYKGEQPIATIKNAGYTDLIESFNGNNAYGYVFDGKLGYLDYALANASMTAQVVDVKEWHINADEIPVFDYNDAIRDTGESSFEKEVAGNDLYDADLWRTSDHDPVLIGLNLRTPQSVSVTVVNDGNSKNSLRKVIAAAGAGDTIDLSLLRGTLNLTEPLEITKNLTLQGLDALNFAISGRNQYAIFVVKNGATLTLNDLYLYRGNATSGDGGALQVIENSQVVLNRVRLQGNQAANGGAIFIEAGSSVQLINSLVAGNYATVSGAGIANRGDLQVINSHIVFNRADGQGGGVFNDGNLTLVNSLIWNNTDVSGRSSSSNSTASVQAQQPITSRVKSLVQGLLATDGNLDGLFNAVNYPQLIQMGNSQKATIPSLGGDFRPKASSVLVDAGNDASYDSSLYGIFDLFGKVRINGSAINIGAFE